MLCPTRWTVCADSLGSVQINYSVLQRGLEVFSEARDMETSAKVRVIAAVMESFDFLFGVMLGKKVLRLVDNLSCTL